MQCTDNMHLRLIIPLIAELIVSNDCHFIAPYKPPSLINRFPTDGFETTANESNGWAKQRSPHTAIRQFDGRPLAAMPFGRSVRN